MLFQAMVASVTSLLSTVKSVEDEAAKGSRALEQTINSIKQEMKVGLITLTYSFLNAKNFCCLNVAKNTETVV